MLAKARGFNTFDVSWCKGQVTFRFLQEACGQARDAIMNSLADLAASKGYGVQSSSAAHALLNYFAIKQAKYAICRRIARVAEAANNKLVDIAREATQGRSTIFIDAPPQPSYKDRGSRMQMKFVAMPPLTESAPNIEPDAHIRIF